MTGNVAQATGQYRYPHVHVEMYIDASYENGVIDGMQQNPERILRALSEESLIFVERRLR